MSNLALFPDLAAVREDAALWIARMDRGLSDAEATELGQWLEQPANRRAFDELGGIWERMEMLSVLADVIPRRQPRRARRRLMVLATATALAASLALVVLVAPMLQQQTGDAAQNALASGLRQTWSTAIGEQRQVTLDDGSILGLNTDTLVEVEINDRRRQLRLWRGEAHFQVAHDAARPFVVATGHYAVRAVGTAFNVRLRKGDDTDVLVTDGTVRVTGTTLQRDGTALSAGQLLELRNDGATRIRLLSPEQVSAATAWRQGAIDLYGQTLAEAIEEIARYTPRRVRLTDAQLGRQRIVGYSRTGDISALLQSIQANNFGLRITETESEIVFSPGATRAAPD